MERIASQARHSLTKPLRFLSPRAAQHLDLVRQVRQYERLDIGAQASLQHQHLHKLFSHAWQYSAYWKDRLNTAGFSTSWLNTEVLNQLSVLTRDELQTHFESMRARWPGVRDQNISVSVTSGSTGVPVRVERASEIYAPLYGALTWVEGLWHQRHPDKVLAILGAGIKGGDFDDWGGVYKLMGTQGRCVKRALDAGTMEQHLDWLFEVKPAYLKCSPMVAGMLAKLAIDRGLFLPLEQVISQSERVTPSQRQRCQQAFGARIIDRYSCEEAGWIAFQCPEYGRLHVVNPSVLLEIVDEESRPCEKGEIGKVLLTSLHSYAMPIIRYDLGDLAEWGSCECGCTWPVLGRLWGRTRHQLQLRNGQTIPMPFLGDDVGKIPSIREFRILQYRDGEVLVEIVAQGKLLEADAQQIRSIFVQNGMSDIDLIIKQETFINWPIGTKREEFVRVEEVIPLGMIKDGICRPFSADSAGP